MHSAFKIQTITEMVQINFLYPYFMGNNIFMLVFTVSVDTITCLKNDVVSFSRKGFCTLGLGLGFG